MSFYLNKSSSSLNKSHYIKHYTKHSSYLESNITSRFLIRFIFIVEIFSVSTRRSFTSQPIIPFHLLPPLSTIILTSSGRGCVSAASHSSPVHRPVIMCLSLSPPPMLSGEEVFHFPPVIFVSGETLLRHQAAVILHIEGILCLGDGESSSSTIGGILYSSYNTRVSGSLSGTRVLYMIINLLVLSHRVYQWLPMILCHFPCHVCWFLAGALKRSFNILASLTCLGQLTGVKQHRRYTSECDTVTWVASPCARPSCYCPLQGSDILISLEQVRSSNFSRHLNRFVRFCFKRMWTTTFSWLTLYYSKWSLSGISRSICWVFRTSYVVICIIFPLSYCFVRDAGVVLRTPTRDSIYSLSNFLVCILLSLAESLLTKF